MKPIRKMIAPMAAGLLVFSLSACGTLTGEEEGFGAGLGEEESSVFTEGDSLGTLGDEEAGGFIDNEAAEDGEIVEGNGALEEDGIIEGDDGLL
jgi:uncharacterized lipoprotein YehR (DUF1307 family)